MIWFLLIVLVFCWFMFIPVRIIVRHPFKTAWYAVADAYRYIYDRQRYVYYGGVLNAYCAHFGGGKTLSVVEYVIYLFQK